MWVLVIAHLSDPHFGGRWDPVGRTRRVLALLAAYDPPVDVVLVTGDIADHGTAVEYAEASAVLGAWAGPAPMLTCPGNHDVREGYAAWRGLPADRPQNEAHRLAGALFVMLDSMVPAPPGERIDHGLLAPETLAWLDEQLTGRGPGERAFVCLHHPPEPVHLGLMDPIRLENATELAAVLDRHRDVVAVLVGHAHSACATAFHHLARPLPLLIPGGIASTVSLDAEPFADLTAQLPPTYAVHVVDDDGRIVTHWRALPMPAPGPPSPLPG
jgi:3',5'-cyclic AMP phosphodiesterase CpdA